MSSAVTPRLDKHAPDEYADRVVQDFRRADLAKLFATNGYRYGAEIGVADGRFSLVLCKAIPHLKLLCVDPWRAYDGNPRGGPNAQHEANYRLAQDRLASYDATLLRLMSVEASRAIPDGSLDFVYIDANHEYAYVRDDLAAWVPKVRSGGIVSGHDFYFFPQRPAGVVQAVSDYVTQCGITDWHLCDEREPSFWWVKQ